MTLKRRVSLAVIFAGFGIVLIAFRAFVIPADFNYDPQATPGADGSRIASEVELITARAEWERSAHHDTYDSGMGANTTCARCKSPVNWDPSQELAQQEALNCNACKRVPGASRPDLESGVGVAEEDWHDIGCEICHIPAGDSFYTGIAYWDQSTHSYREMESVTELCAQCHEGQHGFEVVEEHETSQAHAAMVCTDCHGPHGNPAACQDCHDATSGPGAFEHQRHQTVNCTACHDGGDLTIWYDLEPLSPHFGEFVTRRYAHTLTSWPSHNLQVEVSCVRCHHPQGKFLAVIASEVDCTACHEDGAVIFWCENFPRDLDPLAGDQ